MKTPGFWRAGAGGVLALLLTPLGWLYGVLTLRRMERPGWRAGVPVIAVGNFTAGGAGKTPTAIALARALAARGAQPAFVTRGYGGALPGPLRVEGHGPHEVGDEALLLAREAPTYVARDRATGARLAIKQGASCLILDDALQNPALTKDFTVAVVDGAFGLGNGAIVPAGPLRAPLEGQLAHVDAVVIVGTARAGLREALGERVPLSGATLASEEADWLAGTPVIGFCGLGLPEKFEASLKAAGADIVAFHAFADHHGFSDAEAEALLAEAALRGAQLVTTAKDHVRLIGSPALMRLAKAARVLSVRMKLEPALIERVWGVISAADGRGDAP